MNYPTLNQLPTPPPSRRGWPWTDENSKLPDSMSDGSPWPLISIVTPSYNQGQFLEETIRSVLMQRYPNLEYIIIDGGSSDNSVEIIKKYEPWLTFWVSEPDRDQSHALNKGFRMASGEVFGWLNSDDYYHPRGFATLIELREKSPGCVAWVGACYDIDKKGNLLRKRPPSIGNKRQFGNWGEEGDAWIGQSACLFDAKTFKEIGEIDEKLNYILDVDLWIRLAERGKFSYTDQIISYDRKYPEIKSYSDRPMQQAELIYVNFKLGQSDIARKRMEDTIKYTLNAITYFELLKYFIKRTGIWLRRRFLFFLRNNVFYKSGR